MEMMENLDKDHSRTALDRKKENCLYLKQFKKYLSTRFKNCNLSKYKVLFGAEETKEFKSDNLIEVHIKIPLEEHLLDRILRNTEKIMI